jgi:hypothetical protein
MRKKNSRRWISGAITLAMVALFAVVPTAPSGASHASTVSGIFESNDGNLDVDHTGQTPAAVDWNSFTDAATATAWNFEQFGDAVGNPDSIFGGGTKQDHPCPATTSGSLGGGGSKFDLERIYLSHKEIGGEDFLFLAWVRVPQNSITASAHVAFEFNTSDVDCSTTNNLKQRTAGDTLFVYDFEGGDAAPTIKVLRWLESGVAPLAATCEVASARPCWGDMKSLATSGADARVNTESVGPVDDDVAEDGAETLGLVEFGEAGISLADAGITDPCDISGFVTGVSRSSGNSGTAQMKDLVGPGEFILPQCVATTSIQSNITLRDSATIVGFVTGGDNGTSGDGVGDLTFDLYGPEDTDCDGFLDGDGTTVIPPRFTETIADVATANASTTGGYQVPADDPLATEDYTSTPPVFQVNEGIYNWVVSYTGNDLNFASSSGCGSESADVEYDFTA